LQAALNPSGDPKVERFGWTFAAGDKIMQIENDYEKEVITTAILATSVILTPTRVS
jgi:ATP-dependent exoDNAse (exonuclease V) alpha subunit